MIRLGVNLDHIATLRQARMEGYPSPVQAALFAELGGADNITCHLREDRRHIQDRDVYLLRETINIPLNFEIAVTEEMLKIAENVRPHAVTLVPEKREELTTEGGMELGESFNKIKEATHRLKEAGCLVSLFVEPSLEAMEQTKEIGAHAVEIHTGDFCHKIDAAVTTDDKWQQCQPLIEAAQRAHSAGLQVHFGHGLHYGNAAWLQHVPFAEEANIGHSIIGQAVFCGLTQAVKDMKDLLNNPNHRPYVDPK